MDAPIIEEWGKAARQWQVFEKELLQNKVLEKKVLQPILRMPCLCFTALLDSRKHFPSSSESSPREW